MRRKNVLVGIGVVLFLIAGVVLALPFLVDANRYRGRIEAELQARLGRSVSLGQMRLSLFPLGLRIEQASIGEDAGFDTGRPFAQTEALYVSPRVWPLLAGRFELRAVELRRPTIELVRNASGVWNVSTLGGARADPSAAGDAAQPPAVVLHRLVIASGQVAVTDRQRRGGTRAVYDNIDVRVDGYAPGRAFGLDLSATLPGEGTQRIGVRGTAGPVSADAMMTPFDGTLEFDRASIAGVRQFVQVEGLDGTDAVISGSAALRSAGGRVSSSGSLRLDDTRVRGLEIGYPMGVDYALEHDLEAEVLTISSGTLRLDRTPVSLAGTVNLQPDTPDLDLRVTASDAALAEAARLASAFGVAFGTDVRVQGTMNADLRVRGAANRPALDGSVRLADVVVSGADIPQPVRTPALDLTFTPDDMRSNDFAIATGGTSLGARVAVRQYTSETPIVDAAIRTNDADLGEVLSVARAWGVEAAGGMTGTGRLTLDARASGPTTRLTYSGSGSLRDATLRAPSITEPLQVRTADLTFSQDAAILQNLAASLGATALEGRFSVRDFAAPQVDFTLAADRIDVAEFQSIFVTGGANDASAGGTPAQDGVLLRATGTGTMRVGQVVYDTIVLDDVQSRATLDRGVIRLDPVSAGVFGGRYQGAIVMDVRQTPATFVLASELQQVDANRLASATTNVRDIVFGPLGAKLDVRFAGEGKDAIARSLNGKLSIDLTDGRLANMNLRQEIGNIARLLGGQEVAERTTQLARMTGTFDVTDGVGRTEDLTIGIRDGTMGARGTVNLVDQSVDLRVTAVLTREATERVGGTAIGGLLTTALANEQGELVVPMIVTGTLERPRFGPDTQAIAEMRLKNVVPSLRNPRELTSGLLDALRGRSPAQGQEGAGEAKEEERPARGQSVGDILGGILGRGRQQAPQEPRPAPQDPQQGPPAPQAPAEGEAPAGEPPPR